MTFSPLLIGGLVGLLIGCISYFMLGKIIASVEPKFGRIEKNNVSVILDLVRKIDLLIFPVIGAAVGHFMFGGSQ